jgi:hypothetical protein
MFSKKLLPHPCLQQAGKSALLFPARTERYVRAGFLLSFAEAKERRVHLITD